MRSAMLTVLRVLALVLGALLVAAASGFVEAPETPGASFSLVSPTVSLHEPVLVNFSLRNTSSKSVVADLGHNRNTLFSFSVTDPSGRRLFCPPRRQEGFGRAGDVSVQPGDSLSQTLIVDHWYTFATPGTYVLEPALTGTVTASDGSRVALRRSEPLKLIVTPRDPGRLERICSNLINDAVAMNVEKAMQATDTLSYVVDVVAVPYLARVAERREGIRVMALAGLGRIAHQEGLERVLNLLGPKRAALGTDVRAALANIEAGAGIAD